MAKSKSPEKDQAPKVEAPKETVKEIAIAAPKIASLPERVEKIEKCMVLICNEIGLRFGEPLKSSFAHIIQHAQAPGLGRK